MRPYASLRRPGSREIQVLRRGGATCYYPKLKKIMDELGVYGEGVRSIPRECDESLCRRRNRGLPRE